MSETKRDPTIAAVEAVHTALKPLGSGERGKVLASVRALLEIGGGPSGESVDTKGGEGSSVKASEKGKTSDQRPVGLVELVKQKDPKSKPEYITLYAYYRDKHERKPRFNRDDLKDYFALAKENPPSNYSRDFNFAVKRGWIHEEGDDSYITSKGFEVVT